MNAEGIAGSGRFYMEPVYLAYSYLDKHTAFNHSPYPFDLARKEVSYKPGSCPNAEAMNARVYHFPLDEWLSPNDIDDTIAAVAKVAGHYRSR